MIFTLLIIILSPIIINLVFNVNAELKKKNLFLSPYCAQLFGAEFTDRLIQEFNEANPDIRLQLLNIPDEKNREPDIFIFDEDDYRILLLTEKLLKFDDNLYAVPLVSFMDLLFYNIDLLSAAGFDRPPKTREDFLIYSKAVSNSSNVRRAYVSGAAISLSSDDSLSLSRDIFSWIWAAGGDFFAEGSAPSLSASSAAAFSFFANLYNEGVLAHDVFETTGAQRLEEFSRGRISMINGSISAIPFLRERMGDGAFGITTIPVSGSAGDYKFSLSGIYAGVNSNSVYPQEAQSFILFLAEQHQLFAEVFSPVYRVASEMIPDSEITDDPFFSKARDIFESSEIVKSFSGNPKAQEYEDAFRKELINFLNGNCTAQEAVNAVNVKWERISGN